MRTKALVRERGVQLAVRSMGLGRNDGEGKSVCFLQSSHLKPVLYVLGNCREVLVLRNSPSRSTVCFLLISEKKMEVEK